MSTAAHLLPLAAPLHQAPPPPCVPTNAHTLSPLLPHTQHSAAPSPPLHPAAGQLPMSIPSDIPPGLASLIRRCLSYKPTDRPDFPTILAEVQQLKDALYSRPASQEASRPEMGSPQQQPRGSGRPRSQPPQPQQLSAEEKEQHRARQRQLIREQEAWMARQRDPSAAAGAQKPTVVFPAARAPSLPSPFAAAPAPAPSLASPFAAAPERAPSLPQPAGAQ